MSDKGRFIWSAGGPAHVWNSVAEMRAWDEANPEAVAEAPAQDPETGATVPELASHAPLRRSYRNGRKPVLRHTGGGK